MNRTGDLWRVTSHLTMKYLLPKPGWVLYLLPQAVAAVMPAMAKVIRLQRLPVLGKPIVQEINSCIWEAHNYKTGRCLATLLNKFPGVLHFQILRPLRIPGS